MTTRDQQDEYRNRARDLAGWFYLTVVVLLATGAFLGYLIGGQL